MAGKETYEMKTRLEQFAREAVHVDWLKENGAWLNKFFRIWMEVYRECYYLRALESRPKSGKVKVDLTDANAFIYGETLDRFEKILEKEALFDGDVVEELWSKRLPCPVEQTEAFKKAVCEVLEKRQAAALAAGRKQQESLQAELDRMGSGMAYYKPVDTDLLFDAWRSEAAGHVACAGFPWEYDSTTVAFSGVPTEVFTPRFVDWQKKGAPPHFVISKGRDDVAVARRIVLSMLLSLPVGKLKVTFIDLGFSDKLTAFRDSLDKAFTKSLVLTAESLSEWTRERTRWFCDTFAACGDVVDFNRAQGRIVHGYEVCVVNGLGGDMADVTYSAALARLVNEGYKAGIYFVVIGDLLRKWDSRLFRPMKAVEVYARKQCPIPLWSESGYARLMDRMNGSVSEQEQQNKAVKKRQLETRRQAAFEAPFLDATQDFDIEIGEMLDGVGRGHFKLDEETHTHAFVLGKTGSGKSVFLHTLLHQAMLKYSPQTLQFYLMDFKIGGVELNRYRNYPHVRALMADQGDLKVMLEILRDLERLMAERGRALREAGCTKLKDYNAKHSGKPMPRLVLLVDECQELFKEGRSGMQGEIDQIVTKIAKQGRSQGVHIIFATQTLCGCVVPRDLPSQITDPYLLLCEMADAQRFIKNPERVMEAMVPHSLVHVNAYEQKAEKILPDCLEAVMDDYQHAIVEKNGGADTGFDSFYFSGTQQYSLIDDLRECSYRRRPELTLGRSLQVRSENGNFRLLSEMSQNILVLGDNRKCQGLRVMLVALLALMHYDRKKNTGARFILFLNGDLSDFPDMEDYIYGLEDWGLEIYDNQRQRETALAELYGEMQREDECPIFVFVANQDYYSELRMDVNLKVEAPKKEEAAASGRELYEANMFYNGNVEFAKADARGKASVTVADAWRELLRNGPVRNIFTVWQVQRLANFMFKPGGVFASDVSELFLYMACLPTKEGVENKFDFEREVKLAELHGEDDNLQLYFYHIADNEGRVLSAYALPAQEEWEDFMPKKMKK